VTGWHACNQEEVICLYDSSYSTKKQGLCQLIYYLKP